MFLNSTIGKGFFKNCTSLPFSEVIKNGCSRKELPYYLVRDEVSPLQPWLLWRYSRKNVSEEEEIFDYRLYWVRLVIENSFGILATGWLIFLQPIQSNVETVNANVRGAIWLHSFLRQTNSAHIVRRALQTVMIAQAKSKREIMEWNVKFNDGMLKGIPGVQGSRPSLSA